MKDWSLHMRTSSWLRWAFFFILFGFGMKFLNGEGPFSLNQFDEVTLNQLVGCVFLVFSIVIWLKRPYITQSVAILSFACLFADSWSSFQTSGYVPEQLIEHATKLLLPVLIFLLNQPFWTRERTQISLKIIVALTFIGHGLFAVGWHYVPGSFHTMTTSILGISGNQASTFLCTVGTLDFIAAACLFLPNPFYKPALIYLVLWGSLTTLARTAFPISTLDFDIQSIYTGIAGTIYRFPHAMLPMLLFAYTYRNVSSPAAKQIVTQS
ncbi:MAG: hypothetical protein ACFHU9_17450 [Fluviicola sp.]